MAAPAPEPPIARLPAELLLHIFAIARDAHDAGVPSFDSSSVFHLLRQRVNPILALSHTCRAWRALTDTQAELWGSLHLDGDVDGEGAEGKASWWAEKAQRLRGVGEHGEGGGGITALHLTRVQDWSDDDFSYLCESLELVNHLRLRRVHVSWMGGGAADEHKQLLSFFRLLLPSARILTSLALHTSSHLRILFSLPRLGHTFSALSSLEIRSTKVSSPASDAYLVPAFLPRYNGESEWAPLAKLKRLVLVGPIWRLRYRDGTVASPTLAAEDVPALEYAHLSSTSPQVHWDMLSHAAGSLKHLHLEDWFDQPHLPDPDLVSGSFCRLTSISLRRCAPLATRLLNLALQTPGLTWPNLAELDLSSARLSQEQLELFGGDRASELQKLDLSDSTSAEESGVLDLPTLPALRALALFRVGWIAPKRLSDEVVHRGRTVRLEELRSDLAFGESEERGLRAVGVRLVREEEGDGEE
ncbi:hypothetical protein JCM10213_006210 [Rhodosporidiobolus nylandii]